MSGAHGAQADRDAARRRATVEAVRSRRSYHEVARSFQVRLATTHTLAPVHRRPTPRRCGRVGSLPHPAHDQEDKGLTTRSNIGSGTCYVGYRPSVTWWAPPAPPHIRQDLEARVIESPARCGPSTACSGGAASSMTSNESGGYSHRRAGLCRRWRRDTEDSTASIASKRRFTNKMLIFTNSMVVVARRVLFG
jgi:hypothetical protein